MTKANYGAVKFDSDLHRRLKVECAKRGAFIQAAFAAAVEPMIEILENNPDVSVEDWLKQVRLDAERTFAHNRDGVK